MNRVFCITLLLLFCSVSSGIAKKSPESAAAWWEQGLAEARNGKADSALVCLKQAFSKGLSDDSLYYLWAEAYLYKGVLDTALALNFSVFSDTASALHMQVVKQRHMIYTSLGWTKEADALHDSLSGTIPWYKKLLPDCNLYLSGGGYLENNAIDNNYPYTSTTDSNGTLTNGNGIVSLRVGWQVPIGKTMGIQFGGKARYTGSRFSLASSSAHINDSTDASFGGYLQYSLFSDLLSLSYTFSRKRDFIDVRSFYHQAAIRYAILGPKSIGTVEVGYNYEDPVREHYYYLMTWWNRMVGMRHDFSWMLFLSGMKADPLRVDMQYYAVNVKDGVLFGDTSFTDTATLSSILDLITPSNYGSFISTRTIPQSFWAVNPSVRYEYGFTKRFSGGAGGGYQVTWYRENYKWLDFNYQKEDRPTTGIFSSVFQSESYIAYNAEDANYYWVDAIVPVKNVQLDSRPVLFRSMQRIDQAVTLNLFLEYSFSRIGDIMLDVSIRRNFSNLVKYAPVEIERWYGTAMLTYFFRYRPDIYR